MVTERHLSVVMSPREEYEYHFFSPGILKRDTPLDNDDCSNGVAGRRCSAYPRQDEWEITLRLRLGLNRHSYFSIVRLMARRLACATYVTTPYCERTAWHGMVWYGIL